jgi:hypothetical protein
VAHLVSRGTLRDTIRERADIVGNTFITDTELNKWINDSGGEFNDKLCDAYGSAYSIKRSPSWQLTPGTDIYTIKDAPISVADFKALVRLEQLVGSRWLRVNEFKFGELDKYQDPLLSIAGGPTLAYTLMGDGFLFAPNPVRAETLRMYYQRTWTPLTTDGQEFDAIDGWHELIIADCGIKAKTKQDLDASVFIGQKASTLKRLDEVKQQRNASAPVRITDVTGDVDGRPSRWRR